MSAKDLIERVVAGAAPAQVLAEAGVLAEASGSRRKYRPGADRVLKNLSSIDLEMLACLAGCDPSASDFEKHQHVMDALASA